jgi:hypothetical protein
MSSIESGVSRHYLEDRFILLQRCIIDQRTFRRALLSYFGLCHEWKYTIRSKHKFQSADLLRNSWLEPGAEIIRTDRAHY